MPITDLTSGVTNPINRELDNLSNKLDKFAGKRKVPLEFVDKDVNRFVKGLNSAKGHVNDPTFLGFTILFDWYESPLFKGGINANVAGKSDPNQNSNANYSSDSALFYLTQIGETGRAEYLRTFTQNLQKVNQEMPWYWQSLFGLENAWKIYNNFNDPFRGGEESIISLGTLESVDLRMTGMIDLYQKAVFDYEYTRNILPSNLKYFEMHIFVEEIRKFNSFTSLITGTEAVANTAAGAETLADKIKEHTTRLIFTFKKCQFVPAESFTVFANVGNILPVEAKQTLNIQYKDVSIKSNLPWLDYELKDSPKDGTNFKTRLKKYLKEIESRTRRLIASNIKRSLGLENVYGTPPERIINALTTSALDGVVRDVKAEANIIAGLSSRKTREARGAIRENVFGGNIFGRETGESPGENIYGK